MKHSLKHKLLFVLAALSMGTTLLVPLSVSAAPPDSTSTVTCANGEVPISGGHACCPAGTPQNGTSCLYAKYVNPLINLLSALVGVVVVVGVIVGAIQFSSSAGDPQKAANGKNHIRNALLGLLAYLLLYAFLQFLVPGGKLNG